MHAKNGPPRTEFVDSVPAIVVIIVLSYLLGAAGAIESSEPAAAPSVTAPFD